MFETDLHSHTLFSPCGVHTVLEMLKAAKERGLKGLAITDHGKFVGGTANSVFFERLHQPVPGILLYKGVEANVVNASGETDVNLRYLKWTDIVLLGYHGYPDKGLSRQEYTDIMIRAMETNPFVDIITHPNVPTFPMDYRLLARTAHKTGIALELNNSKVALGRTTEEEVIKLIETCADEDCLVAVNSDAHTVEEPGDTHQIEIIMNKVNFPLVNVVNRTLDSTERWIGERRKGKVNHDRIEECSKKV